MSARPCRVLVAPASMKGALDAAEVAAAIARGVEARGARLDVSLEVRSLPIADGGEGKNEKIDDWKRSF